MNNHLLTIVLLAACSSTEPAGDPSSVPSRKPTAPREPTKQAAPPTPSPTETPTPTPPPLPEPTPVTDDQLTRAAKSIDAFSFDLYRRMAGQGNLIASPASVAIALAMTHGGAKGKTATELSELLHVAESGLDPVQWHAAVGGLLTQWNGLKDKERPEYMPELKIAVANRLFGDKGATFHANFLARTERDYGAPMELVDFRTATEPARQRINGWVEEQTYERIKDLVPVNGVDTTTRMVLVNAVYFKAQWMSPFQEMFTKDRPFLVGGETKTDVPTMSTEKNFAFGEFADDGVRVVELPYETGPFVMDVLVPIEAKGLAAVEAKLDAAHFDKWTGGLTHRKLDLQLPKFKLQPDGVPLSRVLTDMGLVTAFGADADFTGMAPAAEEIVISEVFHKGFIEVNENGTEAAAATAVVARAGGMPPVDEPLAVHIDRPFAFVIRDTSTSAILFMGRVENPS